MPNIIVKNTTSSARTGLVTVGIPFSRAFDLRFGDVLVVNNAKTGMTNVRVQWYGQGNLYDNNAYKYARVTFEVDLNANEEKTIQLIKASGATTVTNLPYSPSTTLLTGLSSTLFELTIEGVTYSFPMSSLISTTYRIEGTGNNDFYRRHRLFTHLPETTDTRRKYLWVDMVVDIPARLNQATFFFRFGYYRDYPPTQPNRPEPVFLFTQNVTLRVSGPRTKFRWEEYKIPSIQTISSTHKVYTLINPAQPGANKMAAGSSHVYKGVFCFTNTSSDTAELNTQILGIAEDWKLPENFPVTGTMPEYPSYVTSEANAFARSETLRSIFEARIKTPSLRGPYNWSTLVNEADTTRTGTHGLRDYAYGIRGMPILRPLNYNFIPLLEFTSRQEGTRHINYYQTNGDLMSPSDLWSNGVQMFHSRPFFTGSTRGFSRSTEAADCATVNYPGGEGTAIYGPDRQHHTVKMFVLQAFISMDWYSLELAKINVNNWINNNRSDTANAFINTWEAARAVGRAYENAAFLYELTYDQNLKFFVNQNLTHNLAKVTGYPNSASLNKTLYPGGATLLRRSLTFSPCGQGACLGALNHWRPWEESAVSLGFYFMAKALMLSEPSSSLGSKILEISRDVSSALIMGGFMECGPTTSRRTIVLTFNSSTARLNFQNALGLLPNVVQVTGQTSGATGVMFVHYRELESAPNTHRVWLDNCSGTFQVGETVTTSVGVTGTVYNVLNFEARKSCAENSPSNGTFRQLSSSEEKELVADDPGNFNPADFPMGYFKYHRLYRVYNYLLMSAPAVVKEATRSNYFTSDNSTLETKADRLISEFGLDTDADNGDFEEYGFRFYGYLDPLFAGSSTVEVSPIPLQLSNNIPTVTSEVQNNSINATVTLTTANRITVSPSRVTVIGTIGATDASVTIQGQHITVYTAASSVKAGSSKDVQGTIPTITLTSSALQEVIAIYNPIGIKRNVFIFFGQPIVAGDPSFVHEVPGSSPGSSGNGVVTDFHKVSLLNTITFNNIITNYYLTTPEHPLPGLLGEAIGLNGQTLTSQGYTWVLPGTSTYETTSYGLETSEHVFTIDVAGRGASIRDWSYLNTISGSKVNWLRTDRHIDGLIMNEVYDTNVNSSNRKKYTPNFLGAYTSLSEPQYTFVSPNRHLSKTLVGKGLVLEGAVTPLEYISYQNPYQNFGGSASRPAIASYMKMYYNIAIATSIPNVAQLDFWSWHAYGIPYGEHQLSANFKLNTKRIFNEMVVYNIDLDTYIDASALLANINQEIRLSPQDSVLISDAAGGVPITLPSFLPGAGRGAIIMADTSSSFVMGVAAGLSPSSDGLTKVTHLVFQNFVSGDNGNSQKIGIESVDSYTATDDPNLQVVRRTPGWVGRRMYVVFGTSYTEVIETIKAINEVSTITSTINANDGLYQYDRPAIL